mgnify:FL=1|jgi:hypothetical protein
MELELTLLGWTSLLKVNHSQGPFFGCIFEYLVRHTIVGEYKLKAFVYVVM